MNNNAEVPIRDAATVILLRQKKDNTFVLMGQRGNKAAFMPSKYVFPGGAVDEDDTSVELFKSIDKKGIDLLHQYSEKKIAKELSVGLFNGLICSTIIFATTMLLGFGASLSITVSLSLMCVIVFAALFGTFIPLALEKRDIDPALATGPFITTANDIIGLIIYFSVSSLVSTFF